MSTQKKPQDPVDMPEVMHGKEGAEPLTKPGNVRIKGLDPEFGDRFAQLVNAVAGAEVHRPIEEEGLEFDNPVFGQGAQVAARFMRSVRTRVLSLVDGGTVSPETAEAAVGLAFNEAVEFMQRRNFGPVYRSSPRLAEELADRAVKAVKAG